MAVIDNITEMAQNLYFTVNGSENDDDGDDLTTFQNEFIRGFNLWLDEYETEDYWGKLRENDYELATVANTTAYVFPLPEEYRSPVFSKDIAKYLKVVGTDDIVLSKFKMVDPDQIASGDGDIYDTPNRATFINGNIVLSRPLNDNEVGSKLKLDVVKYHTRLTRTDDTGLNELPSNQLAILGMAKNVTLSNVTKVALSPPFAQKYRDELNKQIAANRASSAAYDAGFGDYSYITGIW